MHNNDSLLTKYESTAIKGVLISLIVLGHNYFFTTGTEKWRVMEFLYSFHIEAFFIIPFLYGYKKVTWNNILTNIIRLIWIYLILTICLYVGYYIIYLHNTFNLWDLVKVLIWCNWADSTKFCGIQILWFLPAMVSLLFFRDLFYNSNTIIKIILFLIGIIGLGIHVLSIDWRIDFGILGLISHYIPFKITAALGFMTYGIITRQVISKINTTHTPHWWSILSFTLTTVIYFCEVILLHTGILYFLIRLLMPIIFFIMIFDLKKNISRIKIFYNLGKYSFPIYLIHPFIGYILIILLPKYLTYPIPIKLPLILLSLTIVFYISIKLSELIMTHDKIRMFLFPKNIDELKSSISKTIDHKSE